jgi:hypothetical protein
MLVNMQPDPHTVSVAAEASDAARPTAAEAAKAIIILRRSTAALLAAPEAAAACFKKLTWGAGPLPSSAADLVRVGIWRSTHHGVRLAAIFTKLMPSTANSERAGDRMSDRAPALGDGSP